MSTAWTSLTSEQQREIDALVAHYEQEKPQGLLKTFLDQIKGLLDNSHELRPCVHSTKGRLKDPEHLRHKLARKYQDAQKKGEPFQITTDNLLQRVNDLVGVRVLHLHTRQMVRIHPLIQDAFAEAQMPVRESFARTWDDESRTFFEDLGLEAQQSPNFYTSVHYVIQSNSRTLLTAEVQVRTLAEELWGEVDHAINYPERCEIATCREQIKVLARVASSCTRLVDSIFDAYDTSNSSLAGRGPTIK